MFRKALVLTLVATFAAGHAVPNVRRTNFPSIEADFEILERGNEVFRDRIEASSTPDLLEDLVKDGQHPPFAYFGCSDSRCVFCLSWNYSLSNALD
jgi:hypothetical protein